MAVDGERPAAEIQADIRRRLGLDDCEVASLPGIAARLSVPQAH